MRKNLTMLLAAALACACQKDDTDFSAYTSQTGTQTTIYIQYDGNTATVSGDAQGIVSTSGAHVTVSSQYADSLLLVLTGTTTNGSLLVSRTRSYGIRLDGVAITNPNGPAINNQGKKPLYLHCTQGTQNTLADGTAWTEQSYDQKATLFSEGSLVLLGTGTLNVTANSKNAIASDDDITIMDNVALNTVTQATASNGLKANDGIYIHGGTTSIRVASDGGRGLRCDSVTVVTAGTTTISTTGNCAIDSITDNADGTRDTTYSSAACIRSNGTFTMSGGTLTLNSSGDGGKGINCDQPVLFSGGTLRAVTTGTNILAKPKAVKSDVSITLSGGSFYAEVDKSWACDNGTESDTPADHLTIVGTPLTSSVSKKLVIVSY